MQYLTIQDVLWINLQVTKRVNKFDYATLEDATFSQYAVGGAEGIALQAARFLSTFLRMRPITAGSEATALIATLGFLSAYGMDVTLKDESGTTWFSRVMANPAGAADFIHEIVTEVHGGHGLELHTALEETLAAFPKTLESLHGHTVASA